MGRLWVGKSGQNARCSCGLASVSVLTYVSRANPKMEGEEKKKANFFYGRGAAALTFALRVLVGCEWQKRGGYAMLSRFANGVLYKSTAP